MPLPDNIDTALLNAIDHQADLQLSIYQPNLSMLVSITTGSYNSTNQTISGFTLISGSAANVLTDGFQIALIGTQPMSEDLDRTWVRYVSGTSIRFVESDHINWDLARYITVLSLTEIIPVFPRIIQNPADETDVIFYKNYDVPYTNQNSILGTYICMGGNFAGYLENGSGQVYYTASGTHNLNNDALTYSWIFEGGSITGSTAHTPGYVGYTAPGDYRTILTVTSSAGAVDRSIRYISWRTSPQFPSWELSEAPSGARDATGYSCRIKVWHENSDIRDGSIIVIFADNWYGNVKQSIKNNQLGREHIVFWGYIKNGTIQHDYHNKFVEFDVVSDTGIMEISECFSCSVESKNAPSTWFELKDMTISKAIYHYLRWQSTVLMCCDVEYAAPDPYIQYFDADRTSLYDAVNTLMSGARNGRIISDALGKIWIEQDAGSLVSGTSQLPPILYITSKDWIGQPIIEERQQDDVAFIEMGGIEYIPSGTGSFAAYLCDAPGVGPKYRGKVERIQGLALFSQDDLNAMTGQRLATMNSRYPSVEFTLRTNFANLDIAPQSLVYVTMAASENSRGITWNNKPFVLKSVSWRYEPKLGSMLPTIKLSELIDGFAGETIIIPDVPPDSGQNGGSTRTPPVSVPGLPTPTAGQLIRLYDEHIFLGNINAIDIIGSPVQAVISGSTGYFIHSDTGGGGTTGTVNGQVDAALSVQTTLPADNTSWTDSQECTPDLADGWTITLNDGNIIMTSGTQTLRIPSTGSYLITVNVRMGCSLWMTTNLATYILTCGIGRTDYSGGIIVATGSRTFTNPSSNLITINTNPITASITYLKHYTTGQNVRFDMSVTVNGYNGGKIKGTNQQNVNWACNVAAIKVG